MKSDLFQLTATLLVMVAMNAPAIVRYVDLNGASPTPPYTDWATAATTIQDAADAADSGEEGVVTSATCAAGGRVVCSTMTNRVAG